MSEDEVPNDIRIDLLFGVCIKDTQGKVLSQNDRCEDICGARVGEICHDGCMKDYPLQVGADTLVAPPQTIHNVHGSAESCDAVVIRTGSNIITLLFSRQSQIESELAMFERIGFSKMEKAIALLLLDGLSNKDIANKLFISVATVKTHVNNLYKKLPSALKQRMMSIRK